ncbi:hypothetical protein SCATT_46330 [Streptantibioticus cattleyicolor NRRL 8057 = DSM 46488]|uniref:Uncharacterized protein n=1 Tax=Streptantibioticus cattleyicolor (strain ATCC 35852 / DSM 46488 / JCM 4925 / NBRC 14057 / NRRL 8057) TaxID=1003195 RepID=G8X3F3_STREN|nr:hypothetical protein SCATT_46330 [Streptantibioticus cattleyicolor NRRL 8057 = DSM 46488]
MPGRDHPGRARGFSTPAPAAPPRPRREPATRRPDRATAPA